MLISKHSSRSLQIWLRAYFSFQEKIHLWIQASIITEESPSICSLWKQPCLAKISTTNSAWASAMLLVSIGKGEIVIATTWPEGSLIHAPKPDGPGFPFEAPSKFNFQRPTAGGLQKFFLVEREVDEWLIFHPFGMNNCFHFWTIWESHWVTIGLNLITFRLELVTSEIDYSIPFKTMSTGRDSFLKIHLLGSHQIAQTTKAGIHFQRFTNNDFW